MCFWIFPFVRQYRTELFWYFLVKGLIDPFVVIFNSFSPYIPISTTMNLLLLLSLNYRERSKKVVFAFIISCIALLYISGVSQYSLYYIRFILIHSVIIYLFFKRTIIFSAANRNMNLFHIFLLLEEMSTTLKAIFVLSNIANALAFFYITVIFEFICALFFTFYKEDDERLHIKLRHE